MTDTIDVAALVAEVGEHARAREIPAMFAARIATVLQSQADALAEARRELKARDKVFCAKLATGVCDLPDRLATAEASLATMREALEPFAEACDDVDTHQHPDTAGFIGAGLTLGDLRRARRALGGSNAE